MTNTSVSRKALFYLILLLIPLVGIEILLRIFFAFQVGPDVLLYGIKSSRYQSVFDPVGSAERKEGVNHTVDAHNVVVHGYWKYSPYQDAVDHDEQGKVFKVTINSHGFRGSDFETEKKPGTLRVVTLGASSTFGYHDRDDETYPRYLQDTLTAHLRELPSAKYADVEVINLAIAHLTSDEIRSLFDSEALPLRPDVVTFYEGINDAHVETQALGAVGKTRQWVESVIPVKPVYDNLRARLITVALIGNLHSTLSRRFSAGEIRLHEQGKVEHFMGNVEAIERECRANGILFVAVSQQAKSQLIDRDKMKGLTYGQEVELLRARLASDGKLPMGGRDLLTHARLMDALRQWADSSGVAFADVIQALDQDRDQLQTWVHLTPAGNRIAASAIAQEILKNITRPKDTRSNRRPLVPAPLAVGAR